MLSQIQYIDQTNVIKNWSLKEWIGIPFERHLYQVLSHHMEKYNGKVLVYDTPSSRDDGKDIIIESAIDIHDLMGHNFYLSGKEKIRIYIECKTSDSNKISWNQLAGNIARVENDDIHYYVVVTNTTLVPYTFYQFAKAAKERNINFLLIDQSLLLPYLIQEDAFIGEIECLECNAQKGIHSEYQVLKYEKDMQTHFEIYLLIRNYNLKSEKIKITLGTDHDWTLSPAEINILLEKNQFRCLKLVAKRNYFSGIDQLNIIYQLNHSKNIIEVKGMNLDFDFIPPMHGKQHYEILDDLFNLVTTTTNLKIQYLIGESGCGKSRIIDELYSKVLGRNVVMIPIKCEYDESKTKSNLIKLLVEKSLLHNIDDSANLSSIIERIDTKFQKCVLIFDDIHNLDKLLSEIKEMAFLNIDKAITIILIGRNDYSSGTLKYYSFLQWCQESPAFVGNEIKNLTEKDAINMIRSIINDVPSVVLQEILAKSNGNPLFIIQFIEYLLEMNLAHIINRTTVGILNIDTFSTKQYIPNTIEKIYKNRCRALATEANGKYMLDFLFLASFVGITFPKDLALLYFHENSQMINILIKRKFLSFSKNGNLVFFHETLFLYFKKQLLLFAGRNENIWKKILDYKEFFSSLKCGIAYYYNKDYQQSMEALAPISDSCNSIKNYSAASINKDYYEYLDIIYKLAEREKNVELQKKVILYKIYTALHHYAPMMAVNECIHATKLIKQNKRMKKDDLFLYNITELKAHGYLNAGQLKNAEQYLTECLTISLLYPKGHNPTIKFDMYDRLAGLYIKYNHFLLAENFNKLSESLAEEIGDTDLQALALITKAKLHLYINPEVSKHSLLQAKSFLSEKEFSRIFFHNELSIIILQLPLYKDNIGWNSEMKVLTHQYLQQSIEKNYSSSVIRSYLILAVLEFLSNRETNHFESAERFISQGIDASIRYGIATYIWEFYNLKLIISTRLHKGEEYIMKIIETIKRMLKQQNLLYLGSLDFCYANILVLTNIGKYLTRENEFYQFMDSINCNDGLYNSGCNFNCDDSNCQYVCERAIDRFKEQFKHIHQNHLLLMDKSATYPLFDEETGYYIAIS